MTEQPPEAPDNEKPVRTPVFGSGAVFSLVVPLFVFLIGLSIGGFVDSAALKAELEPERARVEAALERTDERGLSVGFGILTLTEELESSPTDPAALREAGEGVLGPDAADAPPEIGAVGDELATYLEAVEAREDARYPRTYTIVLGLTILSMLIGVRGYFRVPFRVSKEAVGVGVAGIVVWIGLWWLDNAVLGLGDLFGVERQGFNPFEELGDDPRWMWTFLAIRFTGLVLVIPIIEEFFLRGFLMRYVDAIRWDLRPLGVATSMSIGAVIFYAVLSHPTEPLAAIAWFGMITWMYLRTKSLWDCVVAHAITNLLLGLFVLATGTWALW